MYIDRKPDHSAAVRKHINKSMIYCLATKCSNSRIFNKAKIECKSSCEKLQTQCQIQLYLQQ